MNGTLYDARMPTRRPILAVLAALSIAAALVATVAGLGVAIPALFGYNYLISKIKNATSDMHVFVDEFVAKMAEFYSGAPENTNWR